MDKIFAASSSASVAVHATGNGGDVSKNSSDVLLGVIGKAKGLRGQVWVYSYTARAGDIASYGALFDDQGRAYKIKSGESKGHQVVITIDGVDNRNAAESLRGVKLYVRRENLPQLDDNRFYITDLIGMTAMDETGAVLGQVTDVFNNGAGDVIDIAIPGSDDGLCLPFHDDYFPHVDMAQRRLTVRVPIEVFADDEGDDA